jgi:hypothetical protein
VNKFVQIANESFNGANNVEFVHEFDDEIYFLSEENSFLLDFEDKKIVTELCSQGKLSLKLIPFTVFFLDFVFNATVNEEISALLLSVAKSNETEVSDIYSKFPIQGVIFISNYISIVKI